MDDPTKTVRCVACATTFTDQEIDGATQCPVCRTAERPVVIAHDVTVTLNWHELRVLSNWASNWCDEKCPELRASLQRTLDRLRAVQPPDTAGLTLADEMGQLHDAGFKAELYRSDGTVIKPPIIN